MNKNVKKLTLLMTFVFVILTFSGCLLKPRTNKELEEVRLKLKQNPYEYEKSNDKSKVNTDENDSPLQDLFKKLKKNFDDLNSNDYLKVYSSILNKNSDKEAFLYGINMLKSVDIFDESDARFLKSKYNKATAYYMKQIQNFTTNIGFLSAIYNMVESDGECATFKNYSLKLGNVTNDESYAKVIKRLHFICKLNLKIDDVEYKEDDVYSMAYRLYYIEKNDKLKSENTDIYNYFYKNLKYFYDLGELKNIDKIIDEYVNEFWQDSEIINQYCKKVSGTDKDYVKKLDDDTKTVISEHNKLELKKYVIKPISEEIKKDFLLDVKSKLINNIYNLNRVLDDKCEISISEKLDKNGKGAFDGAKYSITPIKGSPELWKGELKFDYNNLKPYNIEIRLFDYFKAGKPNKLEIYKKGKSKPAYIFNFDAIDKYKFEFEIMNVLGALDKIEGAWTISKNFAGVNKITVKQVDVPVKDMAKIVGDELGTSGFGGGFIENMIKNKVDESIGREQQVEFIIKNKGDDKGVIRFTKFPEDESDIFDSYTGMEWEFVYDDGYIVLENDESYKSLVEFVINLPDVDTSILDDVKSDVDGKLKVNLAENKQSIFGDIFIEMSRDDLNDKVRGKYQFSANRKVSN